MAEVYHVKDVQIEHREVTASFDDACGEWTRSLAEAERLKAEILPLLFGRVSLLTDADILRKVLHFTTGDAAIERFSSAIDMASEMEDD